MRAGVHRSTISLVERARFSGLTLEVIRRWVQAVQADLELTARWRGGELDRLLDEQHSRLQAAWKGRLDRWGWHVVAEASFNYYGDPGRIDLLGWHRTERILLVVEIKTEIVDAQGLLGALDVKTRMGQMLARDQGWGKPASATAGLIVMDRSTNRSRIERLAPLFSRFHVRDGSA